MTQPNSYLNKFRSILQRLAIGPWMSYNTSILLDFKKCAHYIKMSERGNGIGNS